MPKNNNLYSGNDLDEIARKISLMKDTEDGEINTAQFLYASFGLSIDQAYGLLQDRRRDPFES